MSAIQPNISVTPSTNLSSASPFLFPFYDPFFVAWDTAKIMLDAFTQCASAITLPFHFNAAKSHSIALEKSGTAPYQKNEVSSFGIDTTTINHKIVPVDVSFNHFSTHDMWEFRCPGVKDRPTNVLFVPYSGGSATIEKNAVEALLPYMDVVVVGWPDMHELNKNVRFDLSTQIDAMLDSFIYLGKKGRVDVATGTSQSGAALAALIGHMETLPKKYKKYIPRKIILEVAPLDTSLDKKQVNWLMKFSHLPENIFIPIGDAYKKGRGRAVLAPEVMRSFYEMAANKLKMKGTGQYLAKEHVTDMFNKFYQNNLLATGLLTHRGEIVRPDKYDGSLMIITAENDSIVSCAETEAARKIFRSVPDGHYFSKKIKNAGHYDTLQKEPGFRDKIKHTVNFVLGSATLH